MIRMATIQVSDYIYAQGSLVQTLPDGRVTVDTGLATVTGYPVPKSKKSANT